jgi:hypothetical protein
MLPSAFFFLGLALLLTHELDAIRCKEWRIFPGTSRLGDEAGYRTFTALHVPLYAIILWALVAGGGGNRALIVALDLFFVVHLALHVLLRDLPRNEFRSPFSWALILGTGLCGALDLLLMR